MASDRITVSMNPETLESARRLASAEDTSMSAWVNRAVRREVLRASMRAEEEWARQNPLVAAAADRDARSDEDERNGWADDVPQRNVA